MVPFPHSYWVVPGKFLAGYYPGDIHTREAEKKLRGLIRVGIRYVINLMERDEINIFGNAFAGYEEDLGLYAEEAGVSVVCVRRPIVDYGAPSAQQMTAILDEVDREIAGDRPVYVHCLGGKGRTGTVVGCYLVRHGLAEGDDALRLIQMLRGNDPEAHAPSPENPIQRRMVISWRRGQ